MLRSIGSDMEVFGRTKEGNHMPLCGLIGGSKEQPLQLKGLPKGYMVQEDNVALEFNIPVCKTQKQFVEAFSIMRQQTSDILSKLAMSLSPEASFSFEEKTLTHPNAFVFGCEPDYSAWKMKENEKPHAKDPMLRTCGGHIHVGSGIDMVKGVRNMDLFLGVPSIIIDDKPSSIARRELYGKAGAMRPKEYGWEYRTLSNFWFFSDELVQWVYNNTSRACVFEREISDKEGEFIQHVINTGDKKGAEKLIKKYAVPLPSDVKKEKDVLDEYCKTLKWITPTTTPEAGIVTNGANATTTITPQPTVFWPVEEDEEEDV